MAAVLPVALLALSACVRSSGDPVDAGPAPARTAPLFPQVSPAATPPQTVEVSVYYLTERAGRLHLIRERHGVPRVPRIAAATMEQLLHGAPHRPDHFSPFPRSARVLSVTITEETATVDWTAQVLEASAGAEVEALAIQSVVWTLTEFPTIRRVRFTVEGREQGIASNGRVVENWWGHVGLWGQPWSRDTSLQVLRHAG